MSRILSASKKLSIISRISARQIHVASIKLVQLHDELHKLEDHELQVHDDGLSVKLDGPLYGHLKVKNLASTEGLNVTEQEKSKAIIKKETSSIPVSEAPGVKPGCVLTAILETTKTWGASSSSRVPPEFP